ncbi:MAG: hypothetical protein V1881_00045 [Candidatus Micrarchaeota archaeon]
MAKPTRRIPSESDVPLDFHKQEHDAKLAKAKAELEATPYAMRLVDMGLLGKGSDEFTKIRDAIATMRYYGMDDENLERMLGCLGEGQFHFDKLWGRNLLKKEDIFGKFYERSGISRVRVEEAVRELTEALRTAHERRFRGLKGANPTAYFGIREALLNRIREYDLQKHPDDIKIDARMKGKYIDLLEQNESNYHHLAFLLGITFRDAYHNSGAIMKEIHLKKGRFWHPDLYWALTTLTHEIEEKEKKKTTT